MERLPEHGSCFVCGTENPHSMGIRWSADGGDRVVAEVILTVAQQGPPGYAHGGASAALLDEAMGMAVWLAGHRVVSVHVEADYRKPVPLGQPVRVVGRMVGKSGRRVRAEGQILLPDGVVAVAGRGVYVEAPQLLDPILHQ